ncbi:unnamed protein product [Brachionus calyciflorus]|uniref:Transcription initiation factor IIB n=1 Tax=Brachionus calyciflorus TaxID=104777 RepID=A0A813W108_9BILA|nr:unnamed protein product [Brachionus calyciflorus]
MKNLKEFKLNCFEHPNAFLIEDYRAGDLVCSECGLVLGDRIIDVTSEWRTFSESTDKPDMNRVGEAMDPNKETNLGTYIERVKKDNKLNLKKFENFDEKTKRLGNIQIKEIAEKLNADKSIINAARNIFENFNKLFKGRKKGLLIATCVYKACKQEAVPRTLKEISNITRFSVKEIGRCLKFIEKNSNSKQINVNLESTTTTTSPLDLVARFCSHLNLERYIVRLTEDIVKKSSCIDNLSGKRPSSIVSAAIYLATEITHCQIDIEDISRVCGSAVNTIKHIYNLMILNSNSIMPDNLNVCRALNLDMV